MNTRYLWIAALALTACPGPDPKEDDTDGDDPAGDTGEPDTTETGCSDSGCAPTGGGFFDPVFFRVEANFGWSDDAGSFVNVVTATGEVEPSIILVFGAAEWEDDEFDVASDAYCVVFLPLVDATPAPWLADQPTMVWAVDYDPDEGVAGDCNTAKYPFDPAVWGPTPELDIAAAGGWGIAVGEITPDWAAEYAGSPYEAYVFGGQIQNTFLPAPDGQLDYFTFARAIDDANAEVVDAGASVLLEAGDVFAGEPIQQGWYFVVNNSVWELLPPARR